VEGERWRVEGGGWRVEGGSAARLSMIWLGSSSTVMSRPPRKNIPDKHNFSLERGVCFAAEVARQGVAVADLT
jgi:hypothetical protein